MLFVRHYKFGSLCTGKHTVHVLLIFANKLCMHYVKVTYLTYHTYNVMYRQRILFMIAIIPLVQCHDRDRDASVYEYVAGQYYYTGMLLNNTISSYSVERESTCMTDVE